eukprot:2868468-Pyramimonas_sp.AAC.1
MESSSRSSSSHVRSASRSLPSSQASRRRQQKELSDQADPRDRDQAAPRHRYHVDATRGPPARRRSSGRAAPHSDRSARDTARPTSAGPPGIGAQGPAHGQGP